MAFGEHCFRSVPPAIIFQSMKILIKLLAILSTISSSLRDSSRLSSASSLCSSSFTRQALISQEHFFSPLPPGQVFSSVPEKPTLCDFDSPCLFPIPSLLPILDLSTDLIEKGGGAWRQRFHIGLSSVWRHDEEEAVGNIRWELQRSLGVINNNKIKRSVKKTRWDYFLLRWDTDIHMEQRWSNYICTLSVLVLKGHMRHHFRCLRIANHKQILHTCFIVTCTFYHKKVEINIKKCMHVIIFIHCQHRRIRLLILHHKSSMILNSLIPDSNLALKIISNEILKKIFACMNIKQRFNSVDPISSLPL